MRCKGIANGDMSQYLLLRILRSVECGVRSVEWGILGVKKVWLSGGKAIR